MARFICDKYNFLGSIDLKIDRENGMNNLYSGQLYSGYTVRELNHIHSGNTAYPSGSFVHSGEGIGTWGDVAFSRSITNHRQAGGLSRPVFIYLARNHISNMDLIQ